ncbi:MAG: hypothetical protein EP348_05250 [Alphaproteobacteria bacterium]|nr:MAG: hypothetical protein EP348_05250 [Alphaproteobacteria bacterium]
MCRLQEKYNQVPYLAMKTKRIACARSTFYLSTYKLITIAPLEL